MPNASEAVSPLHTWHQHTVAKLQFAKQVLSLHHVLLVVTFGLRLVALLKELAEEICTIYSETNAIRSVYAEREKMCDIHV